MHMLRRAVEKHFGKTVVAGVRYETREEKELTWCVARFDDIVVGLHVGDCIFLESPK